MSNTISSAKGVLNTKSTNGWCEYEPSYDGVIMHIDTVGAEIFGFESPDNLIGKKYNELYAHPFDHEKTLSMLFRDRHVNGFFTLMKAKDDCKLYLIKQSSTLITEGFYHSPVKVESYFEIFQTIPHF